MDKQLSDVGVPVDATAGIGDVISTGIVDGGVGVNIPTFPVPVSPGGDPVPVIMNAVTTGTVPVVTTVSAPMPPAMMLPTILPVIFTVAVIKALILGKIQFSCLCNAFYAFFFGYL